MRRVFILLLCFAPFVGVGVWQAQSQTTTQAKDEPAKAPPVGIHKRELWTTSKINGSPEPPPPYRTEVAFAKLPKFFEPLELTPVPGTNLLAVAERTGKLFTFANKSDVDKAELLHDFKKTVYGMAFHPDFAKNREVYVVYIKDASKSEHRGTRLVRMKALPGDPLKLDPKSEELVFHWPSGGHNGGCIKFGPDGYLYISTGDGSGIADEFETGQDLTDHFGAMLRIDVNRKQEPLNYGIPKDNPFVSMVGARPEIYAYGIRQCWKYSFDAKTGDLWAGEVGQDLWEMIYKIEKGGNYGWSVKEGTHPFRPERKVGPTQILPPVVEHPHSRFRSITGGYVYHGTRLKELAGQYIYGDYDTGKVWAFKYDGKKANDDREIATSTLRIVGFCEDQQKELLLIDFMGGQFHRLAPAPKSEEHLKFPKKLSETGLFESTKDLTPAKGLLPYSVNAQLWSDGATKERFLALPGNSQIEFDGIEYPQPSPGAPRGWRFPDGTIAVKTFFMEMEKGKPASKRRLETRILHFKKMPGTEEVGDQFWRGYTYVWNDDQTDAELLSADGADKELTVKDEKGVMKKQVWHFPSRTECTMCHTTPAKFLLGVNTLQLNRDHDYGGVLANQIRTWEHLGIFSNKLPAAPEKLPKLANPDDPKADLDARARSYLQANCAHCHIKWGGGNAEFQLISTLALKDLGVVNTRPNHGDLGTANGLLLVPGHPERSLISTRMGKLGLGRMPHIASNMVDDSGLKLIQDWIKKMPE